MRFIFTFAELLPMADALGDWLRRWLIVLAGLERGVVYRKRIVLE
jgi:hypothetical protein